MQDFIKKLNLGRIILGVFGVLVLISIVSRAVERSQESEKQAEKVRELIANVEAYQDGSSIGSLREIGRRASRAPYRTQEDVVKKHYGQHLERAVTLFNVLDSLHASFEEEFEKAQEFEEDLREAKQDKQRVERKVEHAKERLDQVERRRFLVKRRFGTTRSGNGRYAAVDMQAARRVVLVGSSEKMRETLTSTSPTNLRVENGREVQIEMSDGRTEYFLQYEVIDGDELPSLETMSKVESKLGELRRGVSKKASYTARYREQINGQYRSAIEGAVADIQNVDEPRTEAPEKEASAAGDSASVAAQSRPASKKKSPESSFDKEAFRNDLMTIDRSYMQAVPEGVSRAKKRMAELTPSQRVAAFKIVQDFYESALEEREGPGPWEATVSYTKTFTKEEKERFARHGLEVASGEGQKFLVAKQGYLFDELGEYLSGPDRRYLEIERGANGSGAEEEDANHWTTTAQEILAMEKLLTAHDSFAMREEALQDYHSSLRLLLYGKPPGFSRPSEQTFDMRSDEMRPAAKRTLKRLAREHSGTHMATVIEQFMEVMRANGFKNTDDVSFSLPRLT